MPSRSAVAAGHLAGPTPNNGPEGYKESCHASAPVRPGLSAPRTLVYTQKQNPTLACLCRHRHKLGPDQVQRGQRDLDAVCMVGSHALSSSSHLCMGHILLQHIRDWSVPKLHRHRPEGQCLRCQSQRRHQCHAAAAVGAAATCTVYCAHSVLHAKHWTQLRTQQALGPHQEDSRADADHGGEVLGTVPGTDSII